MAQCPYSEYVIDATERNSAGWGFRKSTWEITSKGTYNNDFNSEKVNGN